MVGISIYLLESWQYQFTIIQTSFPIYLVIKVPLKQLATSTQKELVCWMEYIDHLPKVFFDFYHICCLAYIKLSKQ